MVKSQYEWNGPFKYNMDGCSFEYRGKYYLTETGRKRATRFQAFDSWYDNDELYARHVRASNNISGYSTYPFMIYDELPDGWHIGIYFHDGRSGLRSRREDGKSKYLWCETDEPMYITPNGSYPRRNEKYRQGLVRNPNWHE